MALTVDDRDLTKLISCVFLNAIKFTERGIINVTATLSPKSRFLVINVRDTGPGIPQDFLPNLFKPFSREDDSLTRQKEGLGLGLLVAKGLVRKMGGDLVCVRSDTTGPHRGSEFELRVPISGQEQPPNSRTSTPARTRTPTPSGVHAHLLSNIPPSSSPRHRQSSTTAPTPLDRRRPTRSDAGPGTGTGGSSKSPDPPSPALRKASSPLHPSSPSRRNSIVPLPALSPARISSSTSNSTRKPTFDRHLALKHPLTFLVVEDNRINRTLLVNMLMKLGYKPPQILEAFDGAEAVRQMQLDRNPAVDVVLMDLWMPGMDGYEATERILALERDRGLVGGGSSTTMDLDANMRHDDQQAREREREKDGVDGEDRGKDKRSTNTSKSKVTVLAVSADVTDEALERAARVGMEGFMTKPYKLLDLERLIVEYCARKG